MLRLHLLGGASIEDDNGPVQGRGAQRRRIALLALLTSAPRGMSRDKLIGYLWPENETDRARRLLNESVYILRKLLGEEALASVGDDVRLDAERIWCDARAFDVAFEAGDFAAAVSLYRGPFLDGFFLSESEAFERWVDGERDRLAQRYARSLRTLAERSLDAGHPDRAVEWWRRLSAHDPYGSATTIGLMRSLDAAGDRAAALQYARDHAALLNAEFEADPDPEVLALVEQLRHSPAARPSDSARPVTFRLPQATAPAAPPRSLDAADVSPPTPEPSGRVRITERLRRRAVIVAAILGALAITSLTVALFRVDEPPVAEASPALRRIAVFPFGVAGADDLLFLRDGLPILFAGNVDGAGPYRAVDTNMLLTFLHRRGGPVDLRVAREAAMRFGADEFVLGNVVADPTGRLRVTAHLYVPDSTEARLVITEEGLADSLMQTVTRLTGRLLAERVSVGEDDLRRLATEMTRSAIAIKEYLAGEEAFRRARYEDAARAFRRAVGADADFALAYYRLSAAEEWSFDFASARRAADDARDRASGRMSRRRLNLLNAWHAFLNGDAENAEKLLDDQADDPEARAVLGEVLVHHNPVRGRAAGEAEAVFRRLLDLDPSYTEPRFHLLEFAAARRDSLAFDSLFAGVPTGHEQMLAWRAVRTFGWGSSSERENIVRAVRAADDLPAGLAVARVAAHLRDFEAAERMARVLAESNRTRQWQAGAHLMIAQSALAAGQWRRALRLFDEAQRHDEDWGLELKALGLLFPLADPDSSEFVDLRDELERWNPTAPSTAFFLAAHAEIHPQLRLHLLGLTSARMGDTAAAKRFAAALERSGNSARPTAVAIALARSVRGHIAVGQGRLEEAVRLLETVKLESGPEELSVSPFLSRAHDRFVLAEAFRQLGRHEMAERWYRSLTEGTDFPYFAPAHLRLAALADISGNREAAAFHRGYAGRLWMNAEPQFRELLDQTVAATTRAPSAMSRQPARTSTSQGMAAMPVSLLPSKLWWPNTWYGGVGLELLSPRTAWLGKRIGYGAQVEFTRLVHRLGARSPRGATLGSVTRSDLALGLVLSW